VLKRTPDDLAGGAAPALAPALADDAGKEAPPQFAFERLKTMMMLILGANRVLRAGGRAINGPSRRVVPSRDPAVQRMNVPFRSSV
jgi:hypothetical protein